MTIDYDRHKHGLTGPGSNRKDVPEADLKTENDRLKKVVEVQEQTIRRLKRLLDQRLTNK